jgi:PAS domain S-box-containing protein
MQAFESGQPASIAFRVHNLAGEMRWVESTLTPFPAEDGERHVLVVSRDVTDPRRMERELRESRERFQLITENAYDMIVEYDSEFRSSTRTTACARCSGSRRVRARLPARFRLRSRPSRRPRARHRDARARARRRRGVRRRHLSDPARRRKLVLDRRHDPDVSGGNGSDTVVVIARDVSARVEAEQRVRESERRYRELVENAPLGIFVVQGVDVVFANPARAAIYGVHCPDGLAGRTMFDLLDADTIEIVAQAMARGRRRAAAQLRDPSHGDRRVGKTLARRGQRDPLQRPTRLSVRRARRDRARALASAIRSTCPCSSRRRASSKASACSRAGSRTTSTTCSP